jgi:hypothetical protein
MSGNFWYIIGSFVLVALLLLAAFVVVWRDPKDDPLDKDQR